MEFDEGADPPCGLRIGPDLGRIVTRGIHRLGHRRAVRVAQRERTLRREGAGEQSGTGAGDPESGPLLVEEVDNADRSRGGKATVPQGIHRREG